MTPSECRSICAQNGLALDDEQMRLLESFAQQISEWNKKINLISRKDEEQIWERHILHSIALLFHAELPFNCSVADIGTGGGFPGVPLKICRPDVHVVLIDSIQKKITALQTMIADLQTMSVRMKDIEAVCGRAEQLAKLPDFLHRFDIITARAVAPLDELADWSKRLVRNGGKLIALKGGDINAEIKRTNKYTYVVDVKVRDLTLAGYDGFAAEGKKIVTVLFSDNI
ncbi:MAG TPA: 16S rRNA (guanine(527)-N(7))-methyltransferase RsmG [Candidatus Kapabacteria bacterium]|nr:16S rRNA (guanine(527)-N(7))-methyltransferase RsmG [Candidatus Kapabacteria bacterium]